MLSELGIQENTPALLGTNAQAHRHIINLYDKEFFYQNLMLLKKIQ